MAVHICGNGTASPTALQLPPRFGRMVWVDAFGGPVKNLDNSELHSSLMRLAIVQTACGCRYSLDMSTLMHRLYRCPNTGVRVQSYACIKAAVDAYEIVTCNICRGVHLIDRASGRMLSEDENAKAPEMAKARLRLMVVVRNS
jgi:hypothetical protein